MSPAEPLAGAASPYLRQHADNPVHWQQWSPRGAGRGRETRCADPAVGRLRRMPLVPRHGPRVVRRRRGGRGDERRVRVHQGRPRGAARHRRRLHERHRRAHRPGRLADDVLPDARRPALLLRHLLPERRFSAASFGRRQTWRERRDEVEQTSDHIAGELRSMAGHPGLPGGGPEVEPALCDHAVAAVLRDEDTAHGGFGGAPKFPPSALLEALLRHWERTGSAQALAAVRRTGTAMARGGMYDQLAGGFARYSVDNAWVVPHFEKMLYDNALLLRAYAHWARRTGDPLARRVTGETAVSCSTSWATARCSPRRWTPMPTAARARPMSGRRAADRSARR